MLDRLPLLSLGFYTFLHAENLVNACLRDIETLHLLIAQIIITIIWTVQNRMRSHQLETVFKLVRGLGLV